MQIFLVSMSHVTEQLSMHSEFATLETNMGNSLALAARKAHEDMGYLENMQTAIFDALAQRFSPYLTYASSLHEALTNLSNIAR